MKKRIPGLNTRFLIFVFSFLFYGSSLAQSTELRVVGSNGGYEVSPQLSMSWTVGEISISTQSNGDYINTQGFQQSFPLLLALPVELLDFSATKVEKTVVLNWQTTSERNNAGFDLERSDSGLNWETIGFVAGSRTSNALKDYAFTDTEPFAGVNYYRLKQIDLNGHFDYSPVRHVVFSEDGAVMFSVFPNPNDGRFTLSVFNSGGERAIVEIFTSTGQLVWKQVFAKGEMPESWENPFQLDEWNLYYVVCRIGTTTTTQKVVVINE